MSLKISRKRDRQLGNHSLFTVGLEGRDSREEGVGKEEGGSSTGSYLLDQLHVGRGGPNPDD